jgi:hypothetical protein
MKANARSHGARNAGLYLRFLLKESYRSRWDRPQLVERVRQGDVHHAAIAEVLSRYLRDNPRRPNDRAAEGNSLEPLVSRALRGEVVSRQTLEMFIEAFDISAVHAESLWRQWNGQEQGRVIIGSLPSPSTDLGDQLRQYDILMLHEHHWLGADGWPARHRTQVNIRSRVEGLRVYQYRFDTKTAQVRIPRNHGTEIGPVHEVAEGLYAVDFVLDRPLGIGEQDYLEFWTLLKYADPPPPEMRRATREQIEDLYMRVEFDQKRLPGTVWWAEWLDYRGENDRISKHESVALESRLFVQRHLRSIERAVVGFIWEW